MWPLKLKTGARFDVVGMGANTDDHLCVVTRPPGLDAKLPLADYQRQPGGQVPTALVALQRWGARTAYLGVFGDDEGGVRQRASLIAEGVDVGGALTRPAAGSQTSVILIDRISGARTVLWHAPPALAPRAEEIDRARVEGARVVFLDDAYLDRAVEIAGWARATGAVIVLDLDTPSPAVGALVSLADVVIVSGDFSLRLTGAPTLRPALRAVARLGPSLVVATLGAGGALACGAGTLSFAPSFPVAAVDTTSAGDVFHAGVIHGVLRQWPLAETLRFASGAAALTCATLGGRAAIPSLDAIAGLRWA